MAKKRIPFFSEQTSKDLYRLLDKKPPPNIGPGDYVNAPEERPVFRNDSAETVPAYGCMRVTGAAEVDNRWVTLIAKPNGAGNVFLFNGPTEVPAGEMGTAQGTKVVRAYYTSGTVTAGDTWGPGSTWNVTSTGSPKAVTVFGTVETNAVLLGSVTIPDVGQVLIKAPSGGIPQRVGTLLGSATCDVYQTSSSGVISDSTENITVWNWGTTAACANGDRYGWAEYRHPIWYVVSEDCGDEGTQVSASLSLSPADTGESDDFSTTTAGSLFVTPRTVVYTPPVGVVPA